MGNMVTNVWVKFNCDQLRIAKVLGNWKSEINKNKKKNICSAWGPVSGPKRKLEEVTVMVFVFCVDSSISDIEEAFKAFTSRDDIAIILINQNVHYVHH